MEEMGIGNRLKEEREIKGLTYEKISEDLKIQPKFLEALEKEDFEQFPGETYLKAFLRTYSDYLGLKPVEILSLYKSSKTNKVNLDYMISHSVIKLQKKKIKITEKTKIVALLILTVIFLICLILGIKSCAHLSKKTHINTSNISGNFSPLVLIVETTEDVYFEMAKDNEPTQILSLKGGERKEWEANDEFNLVIGNKSGVKITYNGQPLDLSKYKSKNKVIKNLILRREGVKYVQ
ncbi:MAG: helix-turn-helix domain-containing protein [Candidatus Firestonebacteria bacterium]